MRRGPSLGPVLAIMGAGWLCLFATAAWAQEPRHHPPQDMPLHEKFYHGWYMPDSPMRSCCNKADCYPTEAKFENSSWWAKRREDGKWLRVPYEKIERKREMPDARAHLCAPPPTATHYPPDTVFCFGAGAGI